MISFIAGSLLTAALLAVFSGFRPVEHITRMLPPHPSPSQKTLVMYHFYEKDPHHSNLLYFLKYGMHGAADFLFVLNGNVSDEISAALPEHLPNVRVIRRENTCFDLGSYGVVLDQLEAEGSLARYTAVILMNASIIGPIVPPYMEECWTRTITNRLSGSVGLVGINVNCIGLQRGQIKPHVQSMLLALSPAALTVMRPLVFQCHGSKVDAIVKGELLTLSSVLSAGIHASVLDGSLVSPITEIPTCEWSNFYTPTKFHGLDINPYDVMFFKNTPGLSEAHLALYKGFMALRNYSSWDRC